MAGNIQVKQGNIWEGYMDLTVLPCSSKKTIKTARFAVKRLGLTPPEDIPGILELGDITDILKFPGDPSVTKYYTWAASVFNNGTSEEAIRSIGAQLGRLTQNKPEIRRVETPLLGTGAGRLSNEASAKSLARGFSLTSNKDSTLYIWAWDHERFWNLKESMAKGTWDEVLDIIDIKPGRFGINLDLKKLIKKYLKH